MAKPTIYDLLSKQPVTDVTQTQLNTAVANSDVDRATVEFWKGPITIHRALEMRTYPQGLCIPELGEIDARGLAALGSDTWQPPGTEIWQIMAIGVHALDGTPVVTVSLTDGATSALMHSGSTSTTPSNFMPLETPFNISNSLYLYIANTDDANQVSVNVAFMKVGL